ncbi:MAG: hypothetical protein KAX65_00830 [Caldilineaceae bacterium]|nr:hypothetical protein [Caldilineaceae bacterium]
MLQNSYMLRFWRPHHGEAWRVTLIRIGPDAAEQHFTTVTDLLIYLGRNYLASRGVANAAPPPIHEIDIPL